MTKKTQKQNNYLNWQSKLAEDNLNKALQKQREEFENYMRLLVDKGIIKEFALNMIKNKLKELENKNDGI